MARVKRGVTAHKRHKKVLAQVKGHYSTNNRLYKRAHESLMRSLAYAYRDRKNRKRDMRRLWIIRINAASRLNGLTYSRLVNGLALAGVGVDRKMLADLAVRDANAFSAIVETAKGALAAKQMVKAL
jgi:large subunit ribosomal protein L20